MFNQTLFAAVWSSAIVLSAMGVSLGPTTATALWVAVVTLVPSMLPLNFTNEPAFAHRIANGKG